MRLKDMDIYQLTYLLSFPSFFFEKDPVIKNINEELLIETTKDVFEPELSKKGLRARQLNITYVATFFAVLGVSIFIIGMCIAIPFRLDISFVKIFSFIGLYFLGIGIHIALFRGCRASLDEVKFARNPENFKLNKRCYIRWYDFLGGIPLALIILTV